ncbi:MAG: flagellar biosynthesis anti-sigma factor FlgM [Candidatus Adiutrix sp.]|jgi:negative regulator of flagellin synthesis FlgM|nr:flagellar biosynthesis anti-sigma factor FlgM [Candidatus Adiutrix sp.]
MKIDHLNTPVFNNETTAAEARARLKPAPEPVEQPQAGETPRSDVVQLSDRARLVARASELAQNAPEIREERVNELRANIASGTYNVSGRVVADSLLKKSLAEI